MKFSKRIACLHDLIQSSERVLRDTVPKGYLDLSASVPPFPVPGALLNAAQEIIRSENLNYTETYGLPKLRDALAEKHNLPWGSAGVTITTGTSEALFCVIAALLDPGEELLVPALTLRAHKAVSLFFSGSIREYPISMLSANQIRAEEIIAMIGERTKAILVNNPLIATGQLFHPDEFAILSQYCKETGIFILVDESFYEIHYPGYDSASFAGYDDHVISFSSMTKLFSMSGLRIGWLFAAADITEAINSVRYISSTCANTFSQRFALRMTAGLGAENREKLLSLLQNRRKLMLETLQQHNFQHYVKPYAGYHVLLNIQKELKNPRPDAEFVQVLKERHEVIVTPGSRFGLAAEGYIRISFATDEANIQRGVAEIRACVDELNL
ncbi:MAG: pyridoxal phosphate-dependent aminotransferase [Candidatus Marinimicrobia bacterium]|nr:pyridoxal phosphate-dependent aminotransferase [Candidatus Neomarinimicrobiota bacterium]